MEIKNSIHSLCKKTDITYTEIARRLGRTPQAFGQKVKRGSLTIDDLDRIALVSGCKLACYFILPDGDQINIIEDINYDRIY